MIPRVLIWFYDLSQLATVRPVVKSTIVPITLNKEADTVVHKVYLPHSSNRPGRVLIDLIYALSLT
jgi:hypothetical protein